MESPCPSLEELQRALDYRRLRERVRSIAPVSLVAGFLALAPVVTPIVLGIHGTQREPLQALVALIGGLLIVEAAWILASATPRALCLNGFLNGFALLTFLACGILIINDAAIAGGEQSVLLFPFVILVSLATDMAIESFLCSAKLRRTPLHRQPPDLEAKVDHIIKEVSKSRPANDPDAIEFDTGWKGRLASDLATFVYGTGQDAIFAKPGDVSFVQRTKMRSGKVIGVFEIGSRTLKGVRLSAESFQRYLAWKERAVPEEGAKPAVRLSIELQRTMASLERRRRQKREKERRRHSH
jgi:hypothetical protein